MLAFIGKRLIYMAITLWVISIVTFIIIQLPPGDYLTTLVATMSERGDSISMEQIAALKTRYGLDQPLYVQYFVWFKGILHGDFGWSFEWGKPVKDLLWGRIGLTLTVTVFSLLFTWAVAFPIGIYSAVKQYSPGDYLATLFGFAGMAIPNFLLALILMWIGFRYFGINVGGLFSPEYMDAAWSWGRFVDLLQHIWIPMIVVGLGSTANLIRTMRANLLDELNKPYVVTGRAKGMRERELILKYPVRIALNPFISTLGWSLPTLISGEMISSVVLNLPTTGPLFLRALQSQDMYLAGSFVIILSSLTVVGTLLSDIVLAWVDPRIRYE
jgi:peptide/nickel transport system permease protein